MAERIRAQLHRPLVAALVLLVIYVGVSFINDPHGYLGTDTGAKVATLRVMSDHSTLTPDVGYWAAQWDPTGKVHPLYDTVLRDGKWVNVTTLPMLDAALPLYKIGGYRLALLLPMLGAIGTALAGYAIAKRLGSQRPWFALWIVGLVSPLTIYGVDFWEHAPGVALMVWAGILLVDDVVAERSRWWRPLAAGALLALAFTMRTEALVYVAMFALGAGVVLLRSRQVTRMLRTGLVFAVGLGAVVLGNLVLELATVGQSMRLSRASGAAKSIGSAGAPVPGSKLEDIFTTTFNLNPSLDARAYVLGALSLIFLLALAWEALRPNPDERRLRIFGALAIAMYLFRFTSGLGFVPGLFGAAPIAAVALVGVWKQPRARFVAVVALAALPVVWLFQYRGGAVPQWGGRYELVSGTLLLIVGALAIERMAKPVRLLFVGLAAAITLLGAAWLWQRSHYVGDASSALARQPQPVLISTVAHLFREVGSSYGDHRGLTAATTDLVQPAADVVRDAGFDEFGLITIDAPNVQDMKINGWVPKDHVLIEFVPDAFLRVTTYERA